jgi:hypothetical protein
VTAVDAAWLWKSLLWIAVVLTTASGIQYLWRARTIEHAPTPADTPVTL